MDLKIEDISTRFSNNSEAKDNCEKNDSLLIHVLSSPGVNIISCDCVIPVERRL